MESKSEIREYQKMLPGVAKYFPMPKGCKACRHQYMIAYKKKVLRTQRKVIKRRKQKELTIQKCLKRAWLTWRKLDIG